MAVQGIGAAIARAFQQLRQREAEEAAQRAHASAPLQKSAHPKAQGAVKNPQHSTKRFEDGFDPTPSASSQLNHGVLATTVYKVGGRT
jgi:hypothetical protein